MNSDKFKVITFDPNLKFENTTYNIEKNNSIVHDINIDFNDFEKDMAKNENLIKKEKKFTENLENNSLDNIEETVINYNFDELKGGTIEIIDTYLENINILYNKNNIKSQINDLLKKYNKNNYSDYLETINSFYSKNINKYKIIRNNQNIELIDKKTNKLIKKTKIYNIKLVKEQLVLLKKKKFTQKHKLINLYLQIKNSYEKNDHLEKIFYKEKKKYITLNESILSYIYYYNYINDSLIENYKLVFLPNIIDNENMKIIENSHYKIPNGIMDEIRNNCFEQTRLYNKIKNTKDNKTKIITEYLNKNINEKNKINKKINKIILKQNNVNNIIY